MKTLNCILIVLLLTLISCGDDTEAEQGTTNQTPPTGTGSSFFYSDGQCYNASDRTPVSVESCTAGTSQYYSNNGSCFLLPDNTQVDLQFCPSIPSVITYSIINGQCMSSQGQVVQMSYCQNGGGETYTLIGGLCYNSAGQIVDINLCPNNNETYTLIGGQCYSSTGQQVDISLCSNGGGGSSGQYFESNGYCYDSNTGFPVDPSFCGNSGGNDQYTLINGACFNSAGQMVHIDLCSNSNGGSGTDCSDGIYYFLYYGQIAWVNCGIVDCSGQTLYNSDGQEITCN